jgi:hypothetical protein
VDVLTGRGWLGHSLCWILLAVFAFVAVHAARWIGYLVGWLTGASESPMGTTVAPLMFGLLAVLGITSVSRLRMRTPREILIATLVAFMVLTVGDYFYDGLVNGIRARQLGWSVPRPSDIEQTTQPALPPDAVVPEPSRSP